MNFLKRHPARVYAMVAAGLSLAARYGLDLPVDDILAIAAGALLLLTGEVVQRVENHKTDEALHEPAPVDPADDGYMDMDGEFEGLDD